MSERTQTVTIRNGFSAWFKVSTLKGQYITSTGTATRTWDKKHHITIALTSPIRRIGSDAIYRGVVLDSSLDIEKGKMVRVEYINE